MNLYVINEENLKMDGGSCFGVVPKSIWSKFCKADENNMIDICLRSLLIEDGNRLILTDTGMGNKQSEKFYSYQFITGRDNLSKSFERAGYKFDDVTDVILTHLHYDHCGGAVRFTEDGKGLEPTFRNAKYWCTRTQWDRANKPYAIEKASYYTENFQPLMDRGMLTLIEGEMQFTDNIRLMIVNGHTDGQIIPVISYKDKTIVFMSDFIPSTAHIPLPFIPSFDYQPLITLGEKEIFLRKAAEENYILFFLHDIANECCTLVKTEKGIAVKETFNLSKVL